MALVKLNAFFYVQPIMHTHAQHNTFNAKAFLLALLIFIAFGGKEVHILLEHTHNDLEICHVKKGNSHLHAYEQLEHGCSLCDFTFSFFELTLTSFYLNPLQFFSPKKECAFISFKLSTWYLFQSLRAPPTFCFFN